MVLGLSGPLDRHFGEGVKEPSTQQYPDAKGLKYGEKIIDSNQNFDTLDGFIRSFYKDSEILSQFCK